MVDLCSAQWMGWRPILKHIWRNCGTRMRAIAGSRVRFHSLQDFGASCWKIEVVG